jgi:hypothetical protein
VARKPAPPRTKIRRGRAGLEIEGLEEIRRGLSNFGQRSEKILRDALRGRWGQELIGALYTALARSSATGYSRALVRTEGIHVTPDGDVEVGANSSHSFESKHPSHSRANVRSILTWLESGVKPHRIPNARKKTARVAFGGRVLSSVDHPGFRARRPMGKTLRTRGKDLERIVMEELGRQLEEEMRRAGAQRSV